MFAILHCLDRETGQNIQHGGRDALDAWMRICF